MKQYMRREDSVPVTNGQERERAVPGSAPNSAAQIGGQDSSNLDEVMLQRMKHLQRFRENQIPHAEREADGFAAAAKGARSPEEVKSILGERLGADFSSVRFHTDASAAEKAEDIGARAYTSGRDVYFGEEGFDPSVAAHELAHTAQQGAVESAVPVVSAPAGGVQMMPRRLENIGHVIAGGAKKVGRGIAKGAKAVGRGIPAPFRALGRALGSGGQTTAPPQPEPQAPPLGTSMPQLREAVYSGSGMQQRANALLPDMRREIGFNSQTLSPSDGNRFVFMRGSQAGDTRDQYFEMMRRAGRASNINALGAMSQNLDALPDVSDKGSYKQLVGGGTAARDPRVGTFESRAVDMTGSYLNDLESNPDALDALRRGAGMYRGLGTYGPDNRAGMVGGNLEAAHRAMNDMLLRSFGPDTVTGRRDLGLNAGDDKKVAFTGQAMASMQPDVLAAVMDPQKMAVLNPQQKQLALMYQQFFQRTGMLGG